MMLGHVAMAVAATGLMAGPPDPPAQDDHIIVQGHRPPTEQEALRTVTDMTVIVESQIARYHWPVCPMVLGLQRPAAESVENRIRQSAASVGALVDRRNCETNLIVFISGDGAGLVNELRKKRPRWFLNVSQSHVRQLPGQRPVRAWSAVSLRNERGHTIHDPVSQSSPNPPWITVDSASILQSQTFYNIDGSTIVIDADAIEGLSLGQIGDYATMRGLAQIRPPANVGQLNSILSIFARPRGTGPRGLTAFDRRYLGQLYEHLDNKGFERSIVERQRLARAIAQNN